MAWKLYLIPLIVVPIAVCIIFAACLAIFLRRRAKKRPRQITETTEEIRTVESLQYDFSKIKAATGDFADANKLGQGGFGTVYKAKLETGEEIAVKRLSADLGKDDNEFKNEVLLVAKLQHRNLVRLLGIALQGTERILVYELVQNASLDQFIFDPTKSSILDWNRRYKIIGGIARGLLYLHEESRLKIIHGHLKMSNILLDRDMNPKIADSGMARLFGEGKTSKIVETYGYMSPEYAKHGHFSTQSDVFSFGVLVLEIISGQRNNYIQNGENVGDFLTSAWRNWQEGTAASMIDPVLCTSLLREILRCVHLGLLCVQENDADRPTMATVAQMLSDSTVTLPIPSEPAFYTASRFGPDLSSS